jgi:hypothetical protein
MVNDPRTNLLVVLKGNDFLKLKGFLKHESLCLQTCIVQGSNEETTFGSTKIQNNNNNNKLEQSTLHLTLF